MYTNEQIGEMTGAQISELCEKLNIAAIGLRRIGKDGWDVVALTHAGRTIQRKGVDVLSVTTSVLNAAKESLA